MSFSFASMIRLLALGAVGLTMLALGVARLAPPEAACRVESPVTTVSINDHLLGVQDRQPRWLDAAQGAVALTPLPGDDVLEAASCSPWVDAQGRRQVVGRWSNRTQEGPEMVAHEFGIARFSLPDGQLLDRIPLDNVPSSPPCWLPGERARVLFVAGDGRLRRLDFEPGEAADDPNGATGTAASPSLITWDCPQPGLGEVYFGEIAWPRHLGAGLQDVFVASLRVKLASPGRGLVLSRSHLWWLRLDPSGTRITAGGPLIDPGPASDLTGPNDERSPMVARLSDGTLGLAFAREVDGTSAWSISLGTLELLPDGRPHCREASVRVLDTRSYPGPFAFSPDGRWLNLLTLGQHEGPTVARYPTTPRIVARLDSVASVR